MLVFGYLGEINLISKYIAIPLGFIFFLLSFYEIWKNYANKTKENKRAIIYDCSAKNYRKKINTGVFVEEEEFENPETSISLNIILEKLREICSKNDILLIFDEVITGFGRVGDSFASKRFKVTPDIMTLAKGITNATIPMGAIGVKSEIYDTIYKKNKDKIELFHIKGLNSMGSGSIISSQERESINNSNSSSNKFTPSWLFKIGR